MICRSNSRRGATSLASMRRQRHRPGDHHRGAATNTIGLLSTAEDWARFGQIQQAMMGDPETQAAMLEAGQIATWETYVSQTIPDM